MVKFGGFFKIKASGALLAVWLLCGSTPVAASSLSITTLITPGTNKVGTNAPITKPLARSLSADGRITVFSTIASNILVGDNNNRQDVFAYDRTTDKIELISRDGAGQPADNSSYTPTVSANGRYVAYVSIATNILPRPHSFCTGPSCPNVFVYDRQTKTTEIANLTTLGLRLPTGLYGGKPPVMSGDGKSVIFHTNSPITPDDTNQSDDVVVRNLQTHTTRAVAFDASGHIGQHGSIDGTLSGDGRFAAFVSYSALTSEDTNGLGDVYVRDLQTGQNKLVSVAKSGQPANFPSLDPVISNDGNHIVFMSYANNLVEGDTNNLGDIFLRDLQTNLTRRVSVTSNGAQSNGGGYDPDISSDGSYIVYQSYGTNLVPVDTNQSTDIFLYYKNYGITRRVNMVSHEGAEANKDSQYPSISGDGKTIAYSSYATNLVLSQRVKPLIANLFMTHNPVVAVPYYDDVDFIGVVHP